MCVGDDRKAISRKHRLKLNEFRIVLLPCSLAFPFTLSPILIFFWGGRYPSFRETNNLRKRFVITRLLYDILLVRNNLNLTS